jgi:cellulose synthase/poly-beta-1,6-N-acetylglucosamine synthase-like glycosyltransferase
MTVISFILIAMAIVYCISILFLTAGLFRVSRPCNTKKHLISVIIAVHNEEQGLPACLQSIAEQEYPKELYEVIIADDRSTDGTAAVISGFCRRHTGFSSVRVEPSLEAVPKKTALLLALDKAKGAVIVSTDGDCVAPKTWLSRLCGFFTDDVGFVIGHTRYPRPKTLWQGIDAIDYLSQRALGAAFAGVNSAYTCTASNMAYRRELFDANREEFARLKVRPAEDNYFLHCAHQSGLRIAVCADAGSVVETSGAASLGQFLHQRFRWAAYGGNIVTPAVKLFFIPALLFYAFLWIGIGFSAWNPAVFHMLLISLAFKVAVDFFFMLRACFMFHSLHLLPYFLPISLVHPIITPLIVLKGNLSSFVWKQDRYTAEKRVDD